MASAAGQGEHDDGCYGRACRWHHYPCMVFRCGWSYRGHRCLVVPHEAADFGLLPILRLLTRRADYDHLPRMRQYDCNEPMNRRRSHVWLFRTAVAAAAVLFLLNIASGWFTAGWFVQTGSRDYMPGVGEGMVGLAISDAGWIQGRGVLFETHGLRLRWWYLLTRTPKSAQFFIPILMPTLVAAGLAWYWRPRCIPDACCQSCGYDLSSVATRVCPECGATITHA